MKTDLELYFWKGHHSKQLLNLLKESSRSAEALVLCPPHFKDPSVFRHIPNGKSHFIGDWEQEEASTLKEGILEARADESSLAQVDFSQLKYALFTSGSALSKPRLVFYRRENVEHSLNAINKVFSECRYSHIFCYPQPFHTFGFSLGYLNAVMNGIEIDFLEGAYSKATHAHWLRSAGKETLTLGTPVHIDDLIRYAKSKGATPPQTLTTIVGGAPVSQSLWRRIKEDLKVEKPSTGYGCTEAAPGVAHLKPGKVPKVDSEIGEPLEGVEIFDHNEDGYRFRSPSMCFALETEAGIEEPESCLVRDHIEAVGDTGSFQFKGRRDFLLNRGGEKFSLEAIEELIYEELGHRCVAVAVEDERLGQDLALLLDSSGGITHDLSTFDLQRILAGETGRSFDASKIFLTDEIPFSASQKIDRKKAQQQVEIAMKNRCAVPTPVSELAEFLPHRGKAVWVSKVLWANEQECSSLVSGGENSNAQLNEDFFRPSSIVEWMAQSFGYGQALLHSGKKTSSTGAPKAYLVSLKDVVCPAREEFQKSDYEVRCRINGGFGPMSMVCCEVADMNHNVIARADLRLFRS